MEATFLQRHPIIKDGFGLLIFILCVLIGTLLINTFVFRSFNVVGPSMESTLHTGERLIVNRLPVTWAQLRNVDYMPKRGEIIVFKNPQFSAGTGDEYIVKRVIAFPGERVTVKNGVMTVYNSDHPSGFEPDSAQANQPGNQPGSPTSGNTDVTVTDGTLFVSGDHREGDYSFDSRNGLGLIPFYDVIGPVEIRLFPFNKIRTF